MVIELISSLVFFATLYFLSRIIEKDSRALDLLHEERFQRLEDRNHELEAQIHHLDKMLTQFSADIAILAARIEEQE